MEESQELAFEQSEEELTQLLLLAHQYHHAPAQFELSQDGKLLELQEEVFEQLEEEATQLLLLVHQYHHAPAQFELLQDDKLLELQEEVLPHELLPPFPDHDPTEMENVVCLHSEKTLRGVAVN